MSQKANVEKSRSESPVKVTEISILPEMRMLVIGILKKFERDAIANLFCDIVLSTAEDKNKDRTGKQYSPQ